ncbi:MAG TPA: patatin-like phospholipase family protein [Gemmatimonadaceae bacterium]
MDEAPVPASADTSGRVEFAPSDSVQPRPLRQRDGIALCLSGGGYRAALFHLGALRRLNEVGVLSQVTTITSVSGGSILAGHLAKTIGNDWPEPGTAFEDWARVESTMRDFCRLNIRTMPLLVGALPWNLLNSAKPVQELIERYRQDLIDMPLAELPTHGPRYVICATDMTYGVNWIFSKERVGSYQAGYVDPAETEIDVATAVGASSCFPPVFDPLPIGLAPERLRGGLDRSPKRDDRVRGLRLADGGLYDNMGLEPVWRTHEYVLVSEGGSTFDPEGDRGLFWRLSRYVNVMGNQVGALRKRWLISSFLDTDDDRSLQGTYWGIGSLTRKYAEEATQPVRGYPDGLVDDVISEVRTDLDRFSDAEMNVLMNHGYLLAEAATLRWTPGLRAATPPLGVPSEDDMDPARVARELADSHRRRLPFGRR